MLSRIADSLFWMNRYMERADSLLRLTYVHYILSLDESRSDQLSWGPALEVFTALPPSTIKKISHDTPAVLRTLLVDEQNQNSLKCIIGRARENARGVQDHLTKEVWEEVNQMYHMVNSSTLIARLESDEAIKVVEQFARHTVFYAGITDITMSRGLGWNFMNLGKFIERCLVTVSLLEKQLEQVSASESEATDILQWRYLLLALSGYELHLKTYRTSNHNYNVLHQLVLNENFTRSILYSLIRVHYYLEHVMGRHETDNAPLVRSLGNLYSKVRYMDLQTYNGLTLQAFLREVRSGLLEFSKGLGQHYFSYS